MQNNLTDDGFTLVARPPREKSGPKASAAPGTMLTGAQRSFLDVLTTRSPRREEQPRKIVRAPPGLVVPPSTAAHALEELARVRPGAYETIVNTIMTTLESCLVYKCPFCPLGFSERSGREAHIGEVHNEAVQAFRLNVRMLALGSRELFARVPHLQDCLGRIVDLAGSVEKTTDISLVRSFYFACRLALELIVAALLRRQGVTVAAGEAESLEGMLQKLKGSVEAPQVLNGFFRLKTLVNSSVHETVKETHGDLDIVRADTMVYTFRDVVAQSALLFAELEAHPAQNLAGAKPGRDWAGPLNPPEENHATESRPDRGLPGQTPPPWSTVAASRGDPPRVPAASIKSPTGQNAAVESVKGRDGDSEPPERKTKICKWWLDDTCGKRAFKCNYAHGSRDLEGRPLCSFYAKGACANGDQCSYRHAD